MLENLIHDLTVFDSLLKREITGTFSIISKLVGANNSIEIFCKSFLVVFLMKNSIMMSKVNISTTASICKGS